MDKAVKRIIIAGIVVTAILIMVIVALHTSSPQPQSAKPQSQPSSTVKPATQPTNNLPITKAVETSKSFTSIYLTYDWQSPVDPAESLKPITSQRLYDSLITDGITPEGLAVPWVKVRPDLHEKDTVQINQVHSQMVDANQAAIQMRVTKYFTTDAGQGNATDEVDLALQYQNGSWFVDWVSERRA